ncbi:MAG TPA: hypothetical protein VE962_01845 [Actinomycetota bacterium]|jgi:hypothetical protein|nr:hypothetical protein [Actinomycetota bacterium]
MRRGIVVAVVAAVAVLALIGPAAAQTGKGQLFLDGEVVGTVVNPASLPHGGTDPFFMVTNGVQDQLGIAGVGPGQPGYTGGDWAVHQVTFNAGVTPYLLTSDEDVTAAQAAGDVTVTRVPQADFRCPITRS